MKSNKENVHLYFSYPEKYPEEIIESEMADFNDEKLKILIEKQDYGVLCCLDWYMPTIIFAAILTPYFSGFMGEMGKDHYKKLKSGLKKTLSFGKRTNYISVAAKESTNKLSKSYNQSLAVSCIFETVNKKKIKLLFDNDLEKSDWDDALDQIFDYVIENYEKHPSDKLSRKIEKLEGSGHKSLYGIINPETKQIEFYDEIGMINKFNNS